MHNDRMISRALRRHARQLTALALASALVLTGCSGDDEPTEETDDTTAGNTSSSRAAEEPYLDVPDGVELTAQGSELDLGDKATVAYEPRQDEVAALDITVTKMERASFKLFVGWKLRPETKKTTPYFVHATVKNVGDTDLGGRPVPLYAVDGNNRLIESSTFQSTFKPCPSAAFPDKFKNGDSVRSCLVYLAPDRGEVTATSFRPIEEFDPIVWTGEVTPVGADDQKDKAGAKKDDKKAKGDQQG